MTSTLQTGPITSEMRKCIEAGFDDPRLDQLDQTSRMSINQTSIHQTRLGEYEPQDRNSRRINCGSKSKLHQRRLRAYTAELVGQRYTVRAPQLLKSGELCNFLINCRMATPLRGCQAPSICTYVIGLRPVGWSVTWSIQGSKVTFAETLKTKGVVANDLTNLPKHLARIQDTKRV